MIYIWLIGRRLIDSHMRLIDSHMRLIALDG